MLLRNVNLRIAISSNCNMNCIYCEGALGYTPQKPGAMEDFRKKPLCEGNIDTNTLLQIIKLFHKEGFIGITLTGGEPLLNKNWDTIVRQSANIGMKRIEITTNGALIDNYLKENGNLPQELTLIKVSFDTIDPIKFKTITRGGDLNKIINTIKKISPTIKTRANKVLLKSYLDNLSNYFDFCHEIGFKEISLLDLVFYSNRNNDQDKNFFEKEYVSFYEIRKFFTQNMNIDFTNFHKYGHALILPNGIKVILKDSDVAVRNENCLKCPIYCQEGIYTVRIATDGNITICPDYEGVLSSIDGPEELKKGTLSEKIKMLASIITSAKKIDSFKNYTDKHNVIF